MEHTREQKAAFKAEFAVKRRNQFLIAVPLIAVVVFLVASDGSDTVVGIPVTIVGPGAIVLIIGALLFSLYNWRCPACNKYLGKTMNPKFCSRCGVELI